MLLLTREHVKSMAYLESDQVSELEDLMSEVASTLRGVYGSNPVFEHGPGRGRGKSTCCVDHAHLNIFPADVDLMPLLRQFPGHEIGTIGDLASGYSPMIIYLASMETARAPSIFRRTSHPNSFAGKSLGNSDIRSVGIGGTIRG